MSGGRLVAQVVALCIIIAGGVLWGLRFFVDGLPVALYIAGPLLVVIGILAGMVLNIMESDAQSKRPHNPPVQRTTRDDTP